MHWHQYLDKEKSFTPSHSSGLLENLRARVVSFRLAKPFNSSAFWLVMYFLFNLSLTLYNKLVLVAFPFPYTLTAMHALCGSVGCYVLQEYEFYVCLHLVLPSPC